MSIQHRQVCYLEHRGWNCEYSAFMGAIVWWHPKKHPHWLLESEAVLKEQQWESDSMARVPIFHWGREIALMLDRHVDI